MRDEVFNSFKERFDYLQTSINSIHDHAESILESIRDGRFISAETAGGLLEILDSYQKELLTFKDTGKELAIDIEAGIEPVKNAIAEYENRRQMIAERQLVLDYLRLSTEAEDVIAQLEESKTALIEKCRRDDAVEQLQPYGLVIDSVKAQANGLPDSAFDVIEASIGKRIARAADRGALFIDDNKELSPYLDGSCKLLEPIDSGMAPPAGDKDAPSHEESGEAASEPDHVEPDTPETTDTEETEIITFWESYDGYITETPFVIPDVSGVDVKTNEYKEKGILPQKYARIPDCPSVAFALRMNLIKHFIAHEYGIKHGLNLLWVDMGHDTPLACWTTKSQDKDGYDNHYVVAGLFSPATASDDVYHLRRQMADAKPAQITVVVLSEDDKKKLKTALALPPAEANIEYSVLSLNEISHAQYKTASSGSGSKPVDITPKIEMIRADSRIKETKPSATGFINEIDKVGDFSLVREILVLFTYFGVITGTIAGVLHDRVFGAAENMALKDESIGQILKQFVNKSILASYTTISDDTGPMTTYCLTQYGYSCVRKDSVAQNIRRISGKRIGNTKFIGKIEIAAIELLRASLRTSTTCCLLNDLYFSYGSDAYEKIINSMNTDEDGNMSIEIPIEENCHRFRIVLPTELQQDVDQIILGITTDDKMLEWVPDVDAEHLLLDYQDRIFEWNGYSWDLLLGEPLDGREDPDIPTDEPDNIPEEPDPDEPNAQKEPDTPAMPEEGIIEPDSDRDENKADGAPLNDILSGMCKSDKPSDEQFTEAITRLISEQTIENAEKKNYSALADALMLAKAASFDQANLLASDLYQKLIGATGIPLDDFDYTGENLASMFNRDSKEQELMLAAYSQTMFTPQKPYDYTLDGLCSSIIEDYDQFFPAFPRYKGLFVQLNEIRKTVPEGFSDRVISLLGDQAEHQKHISEISEKARELVEVPTTNTSNLPGHRETLADCFGPDSELGIAMRVISENNSHEREFVESIYTDYSKDNGKISQTKIDDRIDEAWRKYRKHRTNLVAKGRTQVENAFWDRLEIIHQWLDAELDSSQFNTKAIRALRANLIKEIDKELAALKGPGQRTGRAVLYWTLQSMKAKLSFKKTLSMINVFSEILFSGIISMSNSGLPLLDKDMDSVKYYEPWRTVIRHILAPKYEVDVIKDKIIADPESSLYDNYRQLRMLGQYYNSESEEFKSDAEDVGRALETAAAAENHFKEDLEHAYTYDRISEVEKERLSALLEYRDLFYDREDFACWRNYLEALNAQLEEISNSRKSILVQRLENAKESLPEGADCPLLTAAENMLEEAHNYAVAEEYLNRFDAGERELSAETNLLRNEEKTFEEFISPEVYNPIFAECSKRVSKGSNFRSFAWNYISPRFPEGWTSRYKDDSKDFVGNWPIAKSNTTEQNIEILLRMLGLEVANVDKVKNTGKVDNYKATVRSTPKDQADYQHPISAFGTQIKNPINVLVLYGKNDSAEIVTRVNTMNLGQNTIVFIDYPLALADRRAVAEYFHKTTSGQNTFLLIDQVLAIFLALKTSTERLPAFLKCTLPFTRYQPFIYDGGPTTDDMFCGRVSELQRILDPQGACVVYGGRQLGKTALLQRAESLRSKPDDLHYAVYTSIAKKNSEGEAVKRIIEDINKKAGLRLREADNTKDLADQLSALFREGVVRSLLLLIDEADDFLESISTDDYRQLQPLVDLKRETLNNFKFVLAGLHNVYRTKNATDRNGIFGQLGTPLCIKPLSPTDALQLISRPLMYLGFQVDRYPHLETILTNTNYYPGILQFFGYILVDSVPKQYGAYFSAKNGNPPFSLEERQLSAIMTSNDLNNSIKEKFRLSLRLDKRYFMLARVIALLYFENDVPVTSRDGFSAAYILDNAKDLGIHCLEKCDYHDVTSLLDEMVEMGILNRIEQTKGYCLRRRSFLNIIGTDEDSLLDEIAAEDEVTA